MLRFTSCLTLVAALLMAGCGTNGSSSNGTTKDNDQPRTPSGPAGEPSAEGKALMLPQEPAGVKGVIDVRKHAKDGDTVVVAGRVGGSGKPFTEGRASFLIADETLKPTEGCDCPWDFCEYPKKDLAAARVAVKFVDADGKTLKSGARELFGIKELSTVVVQGKVTRDDKDNVVVVASRIFVRPEEK